jgi:transposase
MLVRRKPERRLRSGKQVAAYGGLVPRQFQSGEDDRRAMIEKFSKRQ